MRNNMIKNFIALLLFISATSAFSTGVFKWTDADGNIHYGDRPKGVAEEIKVRKGPAPDPGMRQHRQKRDRLLEVFDEERREKQSDKALVAREKAKQEQKCSNAQDSLEKYQTAGYLYKLDEEGNRNILKDGEHALALEQAQDSVDHWCS